MAPVVLNLGTGWREWSHSRPYTHCTYMKMSGPHDRSERSEGEKEGTQVTQLNSVGWEERRKGGDFGSRKAISQSFVVCFVDGNIT